MQFPEQHPFALVGSAFKGAVDAARQHPIAMHAAHALQRFQDHQKAAEERSVRLPPRVVVLPRAGCLAAIIPGDSTAELVLTNGINNFLNLYNTALIIRLVLTWFPNPPAVIVNPLATVCDPYLNLFRGLLPPLGGSIDFSPILAFVVLNLFTNTAAALPAEMPKRAEQPAAHKWALTSKNEQQYQRRVAAQKAASQQQQE